MTAMKIIPSEGDRLKQAGMELALSAQQEWKNRATNWLLTQFSGTEVTSDDLAEAIGKPNPTGKDKNNCFGAWWNTMARQGFIKDTGRSVKSKRKENHSAKITVWEVL